jgi:hypothetical protein
MGLSYDNAKASEDHNNGLWDLWGKGGKRVRDKRLQIGFTVYTVG